jgi:amino acid adenylation domain-containing protein
MSTSTGLEIAIIGMAGRFPRARNVHELWRHLSAGAEAVTFLDDEQLRAAGIDAATLADPSYVKAAVLLEDIELFDAVFFGFTPREAELMDPQQRLLMTCAWQALEDAGYDANQYRRPIGVFAGASPNSYLLHHLHANPGAIADIDELRLLLGNDRDFLATGISYKLKLEGPSMAIQTACSTSLVTVHVACQSLLSGECDVALAGGVSIALPQEVGFHYQQGGILAPDGRCRAFDDKAQGTMRGSGVGMVVLKRLADALADRDHIRAVIRGSAINNDGGQKVGFTAPRTEGQARVVRAALQVAEVEPDSIGYVVAHGTGTALGDPIEVAALTQAFRHDTDRRQFCAIGSIKPNIGHLDAAAGVANLITAVLALEHEQIPPSINFDTPNAKIDFPGTPFFVNSELRPWPRNGTPRRAGVSSFGMGGTNAHVILEEAPPRPASEASPRPVLLPLSARTQATRDTLVENLARALREQPDLDLADVAYTLQVGRAPFKHRCVLVAEEREQAARWLDARAPGHLLTASSPPGEPAICFMFPGQGAQYVDMARGLYEREPRFAETVRRCSELLAPQLGFDLRSLLFPADGKTPANEERLTQTAHAQPALFVIEYALARLWMSLGIEPKALIGHSIGEYTAACLAEVMSLEDALALVAARGRLMQECPRGSMLAVSLPATAVAPLLSGSMSIAADNAPAMCVVGGATDEIQTLQARLAAQGATFRSLHTSHAFHSVLMEPAVATFRAIASRVDLRPPRRRLLSNVSGTWMTDAQATDPSYWADQLRRPVLFSAGLAELVRIPHGLLLEVGPGQSLRTLAGQQRGERADLPIFSSMRRATDTQDDLAVFLETLGRLWLAGAPIDWQSLHRGEPRQRVSLPAYPFEPRRFWIDAPRSTGKPAAAGSVARPVEHEAEPPSDELEAGALADARAGIGSPYVAPRTPVEQIMAEVWQRTLGFAQIGIHDNFFELGGHSLLALQIIHELRARLAAELSLEHLFAAPTIAGLAERLGQAAPRVAGDASTTLPELVPDPAHAYEPFPITDVQHAYWIGRQEFYELGRMGSHLYVELEWPGLDVERLERVLERLIAHHAMLRAIVRPDGQQQILAVVPRYQVARGDVRQLAPAQAAAHLESIRREMVQAVLAADVWPLFDIRATRTSDTHTRVHIKIDFLIADAQSFAVLMRDLARLYDDLELELPPPSVSYRDYMVAAVALEQGELYRRSQEYWQRRIPELPPPPQLPLVQHDPAAVPCLRRRSGLLPAPAWARLRSRAAHLGLTPSGIVCAAYSEILARWSEKPEFTINLTLFNRLPLHPGVAGIVGDFTSTTLLELRVSGGTFASRAQALQAQLFRDIDHQYFGGVRVLRELNRVRGGGSGTMPFVFTSLLTQADAEAVDSGPWQLGYTASQSPQILIDHQVVEEAGGLLCVWDVMEEAFPPGMVDAMFEAFQALLVRLTDDEAAWNTEPLPVVPASQLAAREQANATEAPVPRDLLHTLFEARASAQPEAVAVSAPGHRLTYGQLHRASQRVGARLRHEGARPNQLVAVVMEKGWEQVLGVMGVLVAGAAYLPVDPELPEERLRYILAHGEVEHVLTQSHLDQRLAWPAHVRRWCVDRHEDWGLDAAPLAPVQQPTDLAYVIYTSGSTGKPKGVVIDHRGVVNTILDLNQRFGVGPDDRVLALSALSFDLSVYDIFGILAAGGTIVLPEAALARDPAAWTTLVHDERITLWNTVPALLQMLLEYVGGDGRRLGQTLRLVWLSGDWIPLSLPDELRALVPRAQVIGMGGATEASIWSIIFPIGAVEPGWRSIPYGKPMLNQRFHVLDGALEPCPIWVSGMLYIGGIGLAQGYWRDPERSQASFLDHPRTGERLYRTGDLGRYLPDGNIEFLGRADHQVKVNGYRIELGDIEAALMQHPAVQATVVTAVGARDKNRHLVAYVVLAPGARPESDAALTMSSAITRDGERLPDLRSFLQTKLPDYMVPGMVIPLERLPLSANGKVDRKALPEVTSAMVIGDEHQRPPRTDVERRLVEIWQELLRQSPIGIDANFFEQGGDSLLATQLMTRVRQSLRLELPLRVFFEAATVAELAERIESIQRSEPMSGSGRPARESGARRAPAMTAVSRQAPLPLSFAQQRMLYLEQLTPGSPAGVLPCRLRLSGPLDPDRLERSIGHVVARHESLRTTFATHDGQPVQVISPPGAWRLRRVDLRAEPELTRAEQLRELIDAEAGRAFSLERGPVLHTLLVRPGDEEHVLLLTLHHIAADGWSLGIFVRELLWFYEAEERAPAAGATETLPALSVQYADFAAWQRAWMQGDVLAEMLDYWRRQLAELPRCELVTDYPRPALQSSAGAIYGVELSPAATAGVHALQREERATTFMVLLAAFSALIARYTGQSDIVIGSNIANRNHPEIEPLIGFFANTIVLRNTVDGETSFRELVRAVRDVTLEAQAHQDMPFELLVEKLQPPRDPSRTPLFQLMFVFQNMDMGASVSSRLQTGALEVDSKAAKFDLTLFMHEGPGGLAGSWEYNTDLFSERTIARLSSHFQALVEQVLASPDASLDDVALSADGDAAGRKAANDFYG